MHKDTAMAKSTRYKGYYFICMLQQIGGTSIIDGYSFVAKVLFVIIGYASLRCVMRRSLETKKREIHTM